MITGNNPLQAPHYDLLQQRYVEIDKLYSLPIQIYQKCILYDIALLEYKVNYACALKAKGKAPRDALLADRLYGAASELLSNIYTDVSKQGISQKWNEISQKWNEILSNSITSLHTFREGALK